MYRSLNGTVNYVQVETIFRRGDIMKFKKAKIFWNVKNHHKEVCCIPYDDNYDYYAFLKKCHDNGFRQIIITSELMIQLMFYFVLKNKFLIYGISFMEEDEVLREEIEILLGKLAEDRGYFIELIEKIKFLSEESSIDIKRIYLKKRNENDEAEAFFLQANGLIGSVK